MLEMSNLKVGEKVYFLDNGIYKGIQVTKKKKNLNLIEDISKKGNPGTLRISENIKVFNDYQLFLKYLEEQERIEQERKKKEKEKRERSELDSDEQLLMLIEWLEKFENINHLPTIDKFLDYVYEMFEDPDGFYDNKYDYGFSFTLKDGTDVELVYGEYECILHSASGKEYSEDGMYIYKIIDPENTIFICASCLTRLKQKPEITEKYDVAGIYSEDILFPIHWTDNGIEAWCKKREK